MSRQDPAGWSVSTTARCAVSIMLRLLFVLLRRELFQRGCLDVFILKGVPDVGPFTHLIIGHDGAGPHPGAYGQ
jgi:hypothetical protein